MHHHRGPTGPSQTLFVVWGEENFSFTNDTVDIGALSVGVEIN